MNNDTDKTDVTQEQIDAEAKSFAKPTPGTEVETLTRDTLQLLMPNAQLIPREFRIGSPNPYVQWQAKWFHNGLTQDQVPKPKEGINLEDAMNHLHAIQSSWFPLHEQKVAAVAYLASLWFEEPK